MGKGPTETGIVLRCKDRIRLGHEIPDIEIGTKSGKKMVARNQSPKTDKVKTQIGQNNTYSKQERHW